MGSSFSANAAHRQHGAHVHGVATLSVALEDHTLNVEFESPAVNLVGFEHAPADDRQRQAVAQAAQQLRNPAALFALADAAHCVSVSTTVNSALLDAPAANGEHRHADFNATYGFRCAQPQALRTLEVRLFALFEGIQKIDAQWLTAGAQSATVLTPEHFRITLQ